MTTVSVTNLALALVAAPATSQLIGIDWFVIAIYFGILLTVAWWVVKKGKDSAADYFLAGRNLGWWVIGASIFASNIGSEHVVGLAGAGATSGDPGLAVFQAQGCGSCHTFKPAGSIGKVGPDLDDLAAAAQKANRGDLSKFIEESIVDPAAYLAPGYPDAMPHIFKDAIPPAQLKQLVHYLAKGSKQ